MIMARKLFKLQLLFIISDLFGLSHIELQELPSDDKTSLMKEIENIISTADATLASTGERNTLSHARVPHTQ